MNFNRCAPGDPLPAYRRGIKVANQSAEVVFEDENGEMNDIFQDEMPFDMDAPVIEILPEDYGIWFVDAMERPEVCDGKTIEMTVRVFKSLRMPKGIFVPGRHAMTCCADDMTFLGYLCRYDKTDELVNREWIDITAKVDMAALPEYEGNEGPFLEAISISKVKAPAPKDQVISFT